MERHSPNKEQRDKRRPRLLSFCALICRSLIPDSYYSLSRLCGSSHSSTFVFPSLLLALLFHLTPVCLSSLPLSPAWLCGESAAHLSRLIPGISVCSAAVQNEPLTGAAAAAALASANRGGGLQSRRLLMPGLIPLRTLSSLIQAAISSSASEVAGVKDAFG